MTKSISRREFSDEERIAWPILSERENTPTALASSSSAARRIISCPGGSFFAFVFMATLLSETGLRKIG